jgi:hypothetical protein
MQRDRAFGGVEIQIDEAPLHIRVVMGQGGETTAAVTGGRLDFNDLGAELR